MTELIQVALLNIEDRDLHRRVYSPEGICPTIRAQSGENAEPKILVETAPPQDGICRRAHIGGGYHMTLSIYGTDGLCPTQWASQGKDPIKVVLE